ncbi:hypothetical protein QLQ12_26490 [Actinoplanes sp. NEAU-A12]|uniref:Uncharacterized protein n=1 Tax=Actinoplanes sandaracinus TaxID=3045177 RepID=A0ABT6WR13_9ACTN|nr:hypothetical protein [Actinoplanes sandaracinus]MDI6102172.1 hypothetical protein [Actinoplanes sandaracinus]
MRTTAGVLHGIVKMLAAAQAAAGADCVDQFGQPRDGDTLTAGAAVSGNVDLPEGQQVWLLWFHGAGNAYHMVGSCRAGRTFTCGDLGLESGGDDSTLVVVVVDQGAGRSLSAGSPGMRCPPMWHVVR